MLTYSISESCLCRLFASTSFVRRSTASIADIFDVYMPLIYGEGSASAVGRLRQAIDRKEKGTLLLSL